MKKIQGIVGIVAAAVAAIGPYTFLHVCGAGMSMAMGMEPLCKNVPIVSLITAIGLLAVSIAVTISGIKGGFNSTIDYVIDVFGIILGVVFTGIPTFIVGVCDSAHMHCNMVTKPALIIIGAVVIVISGAGLLADSKSKVKLKNKLAESV